MKKKQLYKISFGEPSYDQPAGTIIARMTNPQANAIAHLLDQADEQEIAAGVVDRLYYDNEVVDFNAAIVTVSQFISDQTSKR